MFSVHIRTSYQQHGLTTDQLQISPEAILEIGKTVLVASCSHIDVCVHVVAGYTQEAGVRCLEREIASVCRTVAVKVTINLSHTPNSHFPVDCRV